jgi:CheY-like chemotaxis protein
MADREGSPALNGGDGGSVYAEGSRILVAGIERTAFEAFAPVLQRRELVVDRVSSQEAGIAVACSATFDLIILDSEPREQTLKEIVAAMRAPKCASRGAAILVLTEPNGVEAAQALLGHGVNRVMLTSDPPEIIGQQVAVLLEVAPRVETRLSTRLDTAVGEGANQLFCQTENVSASGMLVRTQRRLEIGEMVAFEIHLGDQEGPIAGRGEVRRYARPDREGVDGIGIRFVGFGVGGEERLGAFLRKALAHNPGG